MSTIMAAVLDFSKISFYAKPQQILLKLCTYQCHPGGRGGGGDFDKTFMPGGMAFDFMDSPQDADI